MAPCFWGSVCARSVYFAQYCTVRDENVTRAQGTVLRAVVAVVPACSTPSYADMIGSPKLAEIPTQHHLCRSSPLTHTVRLVLLITTKHALEMLLVAVVDVRVSCRRASRSSRLKGNAIWYRVYRLS